MATSGSLNPDLEGTPCAADMCIDVADVMGTLEVELPSEVGAVPDDQIQHLSIPLCTEHAHLLRMGGRRFQLHSGV